MGDSLGSKLLLQLLTSVYREGPSHHLSPKGPCIFSCEHHTQGAENQLFRLPQSLDSQGKEVCSAESLSEYEMQVSATQQPCGGDSHLGT